MPRIKAILHGKVLFSYFLDFFEIVFIASVVFFLVYVFIGQFMSINGSSMHPTFKNGEQLIAEKVSIKYSEIKRGEVLVFKHPYQNKLLIKRVVGLPGENIKILQGKVFINGNELVENYLSSDTHTESNIFLEDDVEFVIPEEEYIVLGDNREDSLDSRMWGTVPKMNFVGRGILVYYPIKNFRIL